MRLLSCFDIVDDKKRRKMVKCLEKYGMRCQYSVFEMDLDKTTYKAFINEINKMEFEGEDKFFIYPIPDESSGCISRYGYYATPQDVIVI